MRRYNHHFSSSWQNVHIFFAKVRNFARKTARRFLANYFFMTSGKDDILGDDVTEEEDLEPEDAPSSSYWSSVGKSNYAVRALSYCDLNKISIVDLRTILDVYPEFAGDFLQNFRVTFNLRLVNICLVDSQIGLGKILLSVPYVRWFVLVNGNVFFELWREKSFLNERLILVLVKNETYYHRKNFNRSSIEVW